MQESKNEGFTLLLSAMAAILLVANLVLFLRMNKLQREVIRALKPYERSSGLSAGTQAPSFSLLDTHGQRVSLQDFAGQSVLLVFSHPSCPSCQRMFPELKLFSNNHPNQRILMISSGAEADNAELDQAQGFKFPILNGDITVFNAYDVPGTPWFFVIDEKGMITAEGTAGTAGRIEQLLEQHN